MLCLSKTKKTKSKARAVTQGVVAVTCAFFVLMASGQRPSKGEQGEGILEASTCTVEVEAIPMSKDSAELLFTCPKGYYILKESENRVSCKKCTPKTRPWHMIGALGRGICPYNMKERVSSYPVFSEAEDASCSGTKEYDDTKYTCMSCKGVGVESNTTSSNESEEDENKDDDRNDTDTSDDNSVTAYVLPEGCTYISQCLDTPWEGNDVQISCAGCVKDYYFQPVQYDFEVNEIVDKDVEEKVNGDVDNNADNDADNDADSSADSSTDSDADNVDRGEDGTFIDDDSDGVDDALTGTLPDDLLPQYPYSNSDSVSDSGPSENAESTNPDNITGTLPDDMIPLDSSNTKPKLSTKPMPAKDDDPNDNNGKLSDVTNTITSNQKQQKTIFKTGMCIKCRYDSTNCDTEKNTLTVCRGYNPLSRIMPFFYDTSKCIPKPEPRSDPQSVTKKNSASLY